MIEGRSVITIGNFDGVHLAHQAILSQARVLASEKRQRVVALTFDPHPLSVIDPERVPPWLMSRDSKIEALLEAGADDVIVMEPTPQLLGQSPRQFVEQIVGQFRPEAIVEGPDFRFGKGRDGDINTLRNLGGELGFAVHVVDCVEMALSDQLLVPVGSTLIRWLLSVGRVADAALCLGRPFVVEGLVVPGARRGRAIGVPTVNLDLTTLQNFVLPADGVYGGWVILQDGSAYLAAINIGTRPTFGDERGAVEAHLLDFDGDLYGQIVRVQWWRWVRDQQRFPDTTALRDQLTRDIEQVRRWYKLGKLETHLVSDAVNAAS